MIDKSKVKRFFSKRAATYDAHAHLQARMGDQLLDRMVASLESPDVILDIGAGTGRIALALAEQFPQATVLCADIAHGMTTRAAAKSRERDIPVIPLTADAELLPLRAESVDLVVSNAAFQWLNDLRYMLHEAARTLRPGGEIWFTMLGHRTLWELRAAFQEVQKRSPLSRPVHLVEFQSVDGVCDALDHESFQSFGIDVVTVEESYPQLWTLLKSLQNIGAQNASIHESNGLGRRQLLENVIAYYESRFRGRDGITATFEVLFGHAKKAKATHRTAEEREEDDMNSVEELATLRSVIL